MTMLLALALQAAVSAPWPDTLSEAARESLRQDGARSAPAQDIGSRRGWSASIQREVGERQLSRYQVTISDQVIGGVPVRIFTPKNRLVKGGILMSLHGGGFVVDSGSLTENIPIAALTGRRVVAVEYRLAPESHFPAALDDALAVYRDLAKGGHPVAVYGTSAGAILACELVARLKKERLPKPVALGFFSGSADLSQHGDTETLFLGPPTVSQAVVNLYRGSTSATDPKLSPALGDLSGWPATLCISSTRDYLLSATADFCRKLEEAGNDAHLIVYEGLPHAFWSYVEAPESEAAFAAMARFLNRSMEHKS